MNENNFFTKVNVPTFDSNYASSFEQFVETINNNFTRIASLPFLKGDNGSSIIIHKERLYDDRRKFTEFGILLVKAIYKELASSSFNNFDDLKEELSRVYQGSEPINNVFSCEQLNPEKTTYIPVYYDQYTGEKHLCVPYIFQDSRKNALQGNYLSTYVDQTKYVIGDSYNKGEGVFVWKFETSDFIPSLYYDEDNSMYCWSINGEKSGITAQGVDGKDGSNSKAWLCKGEVSPDYTGYVKINEVFTDTYDSTEIPVEESGIAEGDLAVVAFTNSEDNSEDNSEGKNDVLFGPVIVVSGSPAVYLVRLSSNNLLSIKNTNDFHTLMKSTGESSVEQNDVLGLYTFGRTEELQNQENEGSSRIPHMFWVDTNETTAHIAPVTVDNNPKREHLDIPDTTIKLGYDTLETNNSSISKHNFNKQFDITNSNYVIVPSTNIKVNDFKSVSMIQKGSLHNIRTAKTVNMSIDLPSLGIKTSSGEIICIDKVRHLIGNDTKPLDISLELTELNCNWKNNDNSSWGGRSYYDVDLFASSATFNENESQAVYVGTTETPIKATIGIDDYFANLQVSVIRYDVAFDEENRPLNVRGFYELNNITKETDLVLDSGMLLDGIKSIGEEVIKEYPLSNDSTITCKTAVSSIKTYTDVIVYLKPYSNNTANDLFYLLNPGNTSNDYYVCLRFRFKDEESGKLVLSHLNDNGNIPCDLNILSNIADEDKILYTPKIIKVGTNTKQYKLTCTPKNIINSSYEVTDEYGITYDGIGKIVIDGANTITKITQNIQHTYGYVNIKYLNGDNIIKQVTLPVSFIRNDSPIVDSFKGELKTQQIIYQFNLPEGYNEDYYGNGTIYGIRNNEESSENEIISTFYFFDTHLEDKQYQLEYDNNLITPIGIHNKYYHILNSAGIPLSIVNNTQSSAGLGITDTKNTYSIKFNDFKWNIGTFNSTNFERYNSGIGCGKLLPFPKRDSDDTQEGIQHTVLYNSPWYLTLSKTVSSDVSLFENIYTDFVFDKSNNVILSNNYVERRLPNDVNCYYLGELYLNNEPIMTKSITRFEIQEFSRGGESNSNTDPSVNPGDSPGQTIVPGVNPDNPGINNN